MVLLTEHKPNSTADKNSLLQSQSALELDLSKEAGFILLYRPQLVKALKNLRIPYSGEAAVFLNQLAFWLGTNSGHLTFDSRKWVYNSYEDWTEQIPSLSSWQFGVMVRAIESWGMIEKSCYAHLRRQLVERSPVAWHPDNTSSWMTLCVERIVELTNWHPFGREISTSSDESPEPKPEAEIANATRGDCEPKEAKLQTQFPSIYIENHSLTKDGEPLKEGEQEYYQKDDEFDPWLDPPQDSHFADCQNQESSVSTQDSYEDKSSAPFCNTRTTNITKSQTRDAANYKSGDGFSKPRLNNTNTTCNTDLEREIWEIVPGKPYPVFINWWADRFYKPQGGRWEVGAYSFAYSEFYKNREKTSHVLFPQFLEYMQTVAENCNQQLAAGIKAILPSCFVARPEANAENVQQLMENLQQLVDRGVEVALPGNTAPGSQASMGFAQATDSKEIKPLPMLEQPALPSNKSSEETSALSEVAEQEKLLDNLARNRAMWKNLPRLRSSVEEWVKNTPGVVLGSDGPMLDKEKPHSSIEGAAVLQSNTETASGSPLTVEEVAALPMKARLRYWSERTGWVSVFLDNLVRNPDGSIYQVVVCHINTKKVYSIINWRDKPSPLWSAPTTQ